MCNQDGKTWAGNDEHDNDRDSRHNETSRMMERESRVDSEWPGGSLRHMGGDGGRHTEARSAQHNEKGAALQTTKQFFNMGKPSRQLGTRLLALKVQQHMCGTAR